MIGRLRLRCSGDEQEQTRIVYRSAEGHLVIEVVGQVDKLLTADIDRRGVLGAVTPYDVDKGDKRHPKEKGYVKHKR